MSRGTDPWGASVGTDGAPRRPGPDSGPEAPGPPSDTRAPDLEPGPRAERDDRCPPSPAGDACAPLLQTNAHATDGARRTCGVQGIHCRRAATRPRRPASIPGATHMSLRVYLVEDCPLGRERLQESLQKDGATVVGHADDATTAITEIAALRPDVVVLDIALREGTGFHVLDS